MKEARDWEVQMVIKVQVLGCRSKEEAFEGAKILIMDDPKNYKDEFDFCEAKDIGRSDFQE